MGGGFSLGRDHKTLNRPASRFLLAVVAGTVLGGCASLPPGSDFPKTISSALAQPEETRFGRQFADAAREHGGHSGFRMLAVGVDGFLTRVQMVNAAERTIDLQYFIFRADETGQLLTEAVLRAADRGVRVRVLVDDGETIAGDEQLVALDAHPQIEVRIFNPFAYRGHSTVFSFPGVPAQQFAARLPDAQQADGRGQRGRADGRAQHRR